MSQHFERAVGTIASVLASANSSTIDRAIASSLTAIGEGLGADRVTLHPFSERYPVATWRREVVEPSRVLVERCSMDRYAWVNAEFRAGRILLVHREDDVPSSATAERETLARGNRSYALAPLHVGDHHHGTLSVGWSRSEPAFGDAIRERVGVLARLLSTALDRRAVERLVIDRSRVDMLLGTISTRLIEADGQSLDEAIQEALEALAIERDVDRAFVYEVREDATSARRSYGWNRPGVSPPSLDVAIPELAYLSQELGANRPFVVRSARDLPEHASPERAMLEASGVRSQVLVPLRIGGVISAGLGLEVLRGEHVWSEAFVERLQLVGQIFSNAISRRNAARIARENQRFVELLASISATLIDVPADRMDAALENALARIVTDLDLVRAVFLEIERDESTFVLRREAGAGGWLAVGERHPIALLGDALPRAVAAGYHVATVDDLPPGTDRTAWERAGIEAASAIVVRRGSGSTCLLGFHGRDADVLRGVCRDRARLLQDVVGNALARRDAELQRARAFTELARLKANAERERDYLREEVRGDHGVEAIVAVSPAFLDVLDAVAAVATTTATVLVRGETGVGKELIARAIHARSARRDQPLVKVDCASIPRGQFESFFFGHVRGAVPGAAENRAGRFELADRGTLFLDEVGEIPLELQARLLRALHDGEVTRVGEDAARRVDVRVIAATNRDLEEDVRAGRFRRDLYYRLGAFPIAVPPLRDRPEDVLPLARHFLARSSKQLRRPDLALAPEHVRELLGYHWPGNVRELAHAIERAVILSPAPPLRLDLTVPRASHARARRPSEAPRPSSAVRPASEEPSTREVRSDAEIRELERANLIAALGRSGGRVSGRDGAAQLLGISPSTLRDRMRAFGIATRR